MLKNQKISSKINLFLSKNCYEILLISFIFHLYGSIFFSDLNFYGTYIRILNSIIIYLASTNSILHRTNKNSKLSVLIIFLFFLNLSLLFFSKNNTLNEVRDISFLLFLCLTLYEIGKFLVSPHRLDKALISASIAGYLLIIEIAVRIFMILFKLEGNYILSNIDFSYHTKTFIDTVYYCTVTITSLGFGDIVPNSHSAKMLTSLLGLIGQFYLVIIMGIMVSKFTSSNNN